MSLDSIITVQIDRTTTTPTAAGFGTPLIAAYFPTSIFPQRVKRYSSLAEMVTDGFASTDPAYLAASACLGQNPSPPTFKIGRRLGAPQQVINVVPDAPVAGDVHQVNIVGYNAAATFAARLLTTDSYTGTGLTIAAEADAEDIVDAFISDITETGDYVLGKSGTGASAILTVTATNTDTPGDGSMDGLLFGVTYTVNGDARGVNDVTPDPAIKIATDLDNIELYDPDWYGLCIDSNGSDEIYDAVGPSGAAYWAESNGKQFVCQTQDIEVASETVAGETAPTIATLMQTASLERTMCFYHRNNRQYVCAAMLGRALPEDAGSITWAYKTLSGVTAQSLTTTEIANIEAKNANSITTLAGVNITRFGTSSEGEYMDVMRGSDWLAARIQERVYALLIQNDKVPYTDGGIQAVRSEILAQLQAGVARDFIAADPEPTCTVPRASEVSAADKASRTLNNVTFRATLAGAVHKVAIEGELNL